MAKSTKSNENDKKRKSTDEGHLSDQQLQQLKDWLRADMACSVVPSRRDLKVTVSQTVKNRISDGSVRSGSVKGQAVYCAIKNGSKKTRASDGSIRSASEKGPTSGDHVKKGYESGKASDGSALSGSEKGPSGDYFKKGYETGKAPGAAVRGGSEKVRATDGSIRSGSEKARAGDGSVRSGSEKVKAGDGSVRSGSEKVRAGDGSVRSGSEKGRMSDASDKSGFGNKQLTDVLVRPFSPGRSADLLRASALRFKTGEDLAVFTEAQALKGFNFAEFKAGIERMEKYHLKTKSLFAEFLKDNADSVFTGVLAGNKRKNKLKKKTDDSHNVEEKKAQ